MNRESEQKRLAELIKTTPHGTKTLGDVLDSLYIENVMVKHLLENGVVVPRCEVGDIIYPSFVDRRFDAIVEQIRITEEGLVYDWVQYEKGPEQTECWDEGTVHHKDFGKTVFLTSEELEAASRKEDEGK